MANNRFSDDITEGMTIKSNTSDDFKAGKKARIRGEEFSNTKPLDWQLGWRNADIDLTGN